MMTVLHKHAPLHADWLTDNGPQACGRTIMLLRSALARFHLSLDFALWAQRHRPISERRHQHVRTRASRGTMSTNQPATYHSRHICDRAPYGWCIYAFIWQGGSFLVELMFSSHNWLITIQVFLFFTLDPLNVRVSKCVQSTLVS